MTFAFIGAALTVPCLLTLFSILEPLLRSEPHEASTFANNG
jgi:hypothetical protein